MAEIDQEPDPKPESESKIWNRTGFRDGSGVLIFGFGFGVNFSDSVHLCHLPAIKYLFLEIK